MRIPLPEVLELDVFTFWACLRDAVIYENAKTEKGREWLRNAWRIEQCAPDTVALHKKYGKGGERNG